MQTLILTILVAVAAIFIQHPFSVKLPKLSEIYVPLFNNQYQQLQRRFQWEIETILLDKQISPDEQKQLLDLNTRVHWTIKFDCDWEGFDITLTRIITEREASRRFGGLLHKYPQLVQVFR
jgi:hypothetical protein